MDNGTTVAELREMIEAFITERDWVQFHTPKNHCLAFANRTGIDVAEAVRHKLRKNRRRYPIRKYRGRF